MHRPLRPPPRRRLRIGPAHICAALAALLLLISVSVLYARLAASHSRRSFIPTTVSGDPNFPGFDDFDAGGDSADPIDEWDELEEDDAGLDVTAAALDKQSSELYWDHAAGVARRSFGKLGATDPGGSSNPPGVAAFASDDQPLDESVREKLEEINSVEDALFLNSGGRSKLRDGWAPWFEQKGPYLRRDRMLRGNLESLMPMNNPLLQDPDMPGLTSLTRNDKIVQKVMLDEMFKVPFGSDIPKNGRDSSVRKLNSQVHDQTSSNKNIYLRRSKGKEPIYADGKRWGYFSGLNAELSFSEFMRQFLGKGNCSVSIFMVWNGPDWKYGVRHQRGLESVLRVHPDACVAVFSETIELNFFSDFLDEGYKVAVAMPNLDELLKGTPVRRFASAWHKWRKIPLYSIHYSELIRLAALYKYGGVYLDTDMIVLNPLNLLQDFVAVEEQTKGATLNGALMAFGKRSSFLLECMREYHATYDDKLVRWNGADLLSRVRDRLKEDAHSLVFKQKIVQSWKIFPICLKNISRYFVAPIDEDEVAQQNFLFDKIIDESLTFHFWNSLTYSLLPQPGSLVEMVLNHHCLHCTDVL